MNRLLISLIVAGLVCGCASPRPASPTVAEEHLACDGKILYEAGRYDEARTRFELLLDTTSNQRLRTSATYFLDRINQGIPPEPLDPRVPRCFGP